MSSLYSLEDNVRFSGLKVTKKITLSFDFCRRFLQYDSPLGCMNKIKINHRHIDYKVW